MDIRRAHAEKMRMRAESIPHSVEEGNAKQPDAQVVADGNSAHPVANTKKKKKSKDEKETIDAMDAHEVVPYIIGKKPSTGLARYALEHMVEIWEEEDSAE